MELQADRRLPVDNMSTRHDELRADGDSRTPDWPAVHQAHSWVSVKARLVGRGGHAEGWPNGVEPNILEQTPEARAAEDAPEDRLDGADEREAYPLVGLPAKRRHYHSDQTRVARALHREYPSSLGAR